MCNLSKEILDKLETPCIVIDLQKAIKNIDDMQAQATSANCTLRPHIKTHKMKRFAKLQLEHGCSGITCAKVSEAEVMADSVADKYIADIFIADIFIAYPLVGEFRIKRAINLARKIKRLILAVDSIECASMMNALAVEEDTILEVRLEVDTGAKRTGVMYENVLNVAQQINTMSNLNLTGIYTFKGLVFENKTTTSIQDASTEEGEMMENIANMLKQNGIPIKDISAGSSPTGVAVANTGKVNEIRPGTYIFKDFMLYKEGVAELEDIAAHFYVTVVSTPCDEYAVIDGGTKTFPTDILLGTPPYFYDSYAVVKGHDNLKLTRLNEEHGIITAMDKKTGLKVGQKLCLIPVHICTAINLQNYVYIYDKDNLVKEKVDARGMLV